MSSVEVVTGITQGGKAWVPQFVQSIDGEKCIGCGRCFKVCGRGVMRLTPVDENGVLLEADEDGEEFEKQIMVLVHPENCIGCEACSRVCPKDCYTHGAVETPCAEMLQ